MIDEETLSLMSEYSYTTVGPVIYSFVSWILETAKRRGIRTLYFLARDGYTLMRVAEKICRTRDLGITCKYLFCSRKALRTPTYHLIGEEMYTLLLACGYFATPRSILGRADIYGEEANTILSELGISEPTRPLSDLEFSAVCDKIRKNKTYYEAVIKKSTEAYPAAMAYFRSQGLLSEPVVAIVDSGWTGSMQRSLRQLLRSGGYCGNFVGFYFGLYTPQRPEDGEYLTYYFDSVGGSRRKASFNNNLFECMLAAPHPMTCGYRLTTDGAEPEFAKDNNTGILPLIQCQSDGILRYAADALKSSDKSGVLSGESVERLLRRAMVYPTRSEVLMYSHFGFCDDVTEDYSLPLASERLRQTLKRYMLFPRILDKLSGRRREGSLLWPYGVIALMPPLLRPWYRINVMLWDRLKHRLK